MSLMENWPLAKPFVANAIIMAIGEAIRGQRHNDGHQKHYPPFLSPGPGREVLRSFHPTAWPKRVSKAAKGDGIINWGF